MKKSICSGNSQNRYSRSHQYLRLSYTYIPNHFKFKTINSGASISAFHSFENFVTVAPSKTR